MKKILRSRYWIFFAFHIALDPISGKIKKKNKISRIPTKNPRVKKSIFGVLESIFIRKLKFLVCMSSYPKKEVRKKKLFFPSNIYDIRSKKRFWRFLAISLRKKTFFFLSFLSFYMVGLQEKIENRFFQIARFLGEVPHNWRFKFLTYPK